MEFRNCRNCGRVFQSNGYGRICPKCQMEDEANYALVKEYIYDNPGATIPEVSGATGVDQGKILQYLREGRLEIIGHSMILDCERCGKSISTGRYCGACAKEMERGFKDAFSNENQKNKEEVRMYTAEMKNKR